MDYKNKVSHYLGKTAGKRWKDITSDIVAVVGGIKPSFLYDYSSCDAKSLNKLAAELELICNSNSTTSVEKANCHIDGQKSRENLCTRLTGVLIIQDDVFVFNKQTLRSKLKRFVARSNDQHDDRCATSSEQHADEQVCTIIDVSGNLAHPTLADVNISKQLVAIAKDILEQIEAGYAETNSGEQVLTLHLEADWNVSTIFGLLLGYPVLYWYQMDMEENCLAHTPLHVVKCKCDCIVKTRRYDSPNDATTYTTFEKKDHVIYSFSIPSSLEANARKHISEWKESIFHVVDLCGYFNNVSFDCSSVTLPVVAL